MEDDELLYREMNEEDPFYMGDSSEEYDVPDIAPRRKKEEEEGEEDNEQLFLTLDEMEDYLDEAIKKLQQ
ncbi:MAG: hypothetical protein LBN29_09310 [Mediterranea sp.]|jgi:hypothetical protein|nr:hypothetical protein [Mediterranea sp.]